MKFYSEKLNKFFDTEEECYDAERAQNSEGVKKETEVNKAESNEKKQYVKKIEEADNNLEIEYLNYNEAKKKVIELKKKNDAECEKILTEARKALKEAQNKKFDAVQSFTEKYGPYKVSYTGEKALQEMRRHVDMSNDFLNWFFPFFNW